MIFTTGINLFLKEKQSCHAQSIVLDIGRILNNVENFEMTALYNRIGS